MALQKRNKESSFMDLFEKFITDSKTGKRVQPNGKLISPGTIANYQNALRLVRVFSNETGFVLRLRRINCLSNRELQSEKIYWKKFHHRFTDYLYKECGHFDNYVSSIIKTIKTFFAYLNKELMLGVGEFHKKFYIRKEDIGVLVLLPEELNFLIYNKEFEKSLSISLQKTKDIFVFGCTVALRFSDLSSLMSSNLRISNDAWYLDARAKKTGACLLMKLPDYATDILKKYARNKRRTYNLLPPISNARLNKNIKKLMEMAGFTGSVKKIRERRGIGKELFKTKSDGRMDFRICDLMSTHTMRRTAITTMLTLGVPEQIVRKISGHAPGSKEFYKYVSISQSYLEKETNKMFELLKRKNYVTTMI
jgi:site-specific recombinase XerD